MVQGKRKSFFFLLSKVYERVSCHHDGFALGDQSETPSLELEFDIPLSVKSMKLFFMLGKAAKSRLGKLNFMQSLSQLAISKLYSWA